jgi:type VI protein secretion system component VasK
VSEDKPFADTIVVPSWVRTAIVALVVAALPSLTMWTVNLEYRVRLAEAELLEAKERDKTLSKIERDVAVIKTQMEYVQATVERIEKRNESK